MLLALSATAIVVIALLWEVCWPAMSEAIDRHRARRARVPTFDYDPGRERRAEQRARELLRSCVNEEEWDMYRDLGFVRVWGGMADGPERGAARDSLAGAPYAYLIYPHKPIVAYLPQTRRLLNEYCVVFPDESRPYGSPRLPDSDDVLAKWMALTGDEERLIAEANMHLPGRQVDPQQVKRDLWRLSEWERQRAARERRTGHGSVSAP
ncbi:hypothetical protein [Capillimicrobium parvum]|uniref:Uncharacterized protein n=1 Tax=Capillimicrobium parvum TaxID=2884022 RepID=A0A9E6XWL8_9ACTN|nr:hypothetical protein [Capillimicrobium parvum]UGS35861.1 hypothetical protein DSM104329_02258 [Capillimicrobium parvum]